MLEVRVGIVGIGNIGSAHCKSIYSGKIKGLKLVSLCDINDKKLQAMNYSDILLFSDYKKMIKSGEIDAVIISTPHKLHSEIAMFALDNGVNVLSEKPIDITISQAKKINEKALKSDKVFAIMFNQRTDFLYKKAKELVESGEIGEIKRSVWIITNWFRTQSYYDSGDWRATWSGEGGGVLLNQAPHNLDLWQWICGMPKSITAFCNEGKYHKIEVEDEVTIYSQFENGATGIFITTTADFPGTNRLEITGDKGKIVLENKKIMFYKLKKSTKDVMENSKENFVGIDYYCQEFCEEIKEDLLNGHEKILQNFTNAILYGEELVAKGVEGINELTISNAAYLSQWLGNKSVELPFDDIIFDDYLHKKAEKSGFIEVENKSNTPSSKYSERWGVRW